MEVGVAPLHQGLALCIRVGSDMIVCARATGVAFSTDVPGQTHGLGWLHLGHGKGWEVTPADLLSDGATPHCGHVLEPGEDTGNEGSVFQTLATTTAKIG